MNFYRLWIIIYTIGRLAVCKMLDRKLFPNCFYTCQEPYTSEPPEMHIQDALDWSSDIKKYSVDHPIIVGEWSMSTGTFVQAGQPFVDACLESFALTLGHYAWNWKIETNIGFDEWNVQYQAFNVEDGMRIL